MKTFPYFRSESPLRSVILLLFALPFLAFYLNDPLTLSIVLKELFLPALYSNHVVSLINRHPPHVLWIMNFFILNCRIILFSIFFFRNEDM